MARRERQRKDRREKNACGKAGERGQKIGKAGKWETGRARYLSAVALREGWILNAPRASDDESPHAMDAKEIHDLSFATVAPFV
jgi:hypothetical protein